MVFEFNNRPCYPTFFFEFPKLLSLWHPKEVIKGLLTTIIQAFAKFKAFSWIPQWMYGFRFSYWDDSSEKTSRNLGCISNPVANSKINYPPVILAFLLLASRLPCHKCIPNRPNCLNDPFSQTTTSELPFFLLTQGTIFFKLLVARMVESFEQLGWFEGDDSLILGQIDRVSVRNDRKNHPEMARNLNPYTDWY